MALPTGPSHNINLGKLSLTDEQFKRVSKLIRFAVHSVVFHKDEALEQDVWVAVIRAANRYDPRKGVTFDNYIFARARGAVLDSLRKNKLGGRTNPDVHVVEIFGITQSGVSAQIINARKKVRTR